MAGRTRSELSHNISYPAGIALLGALTVLAGCSAQAAPGGAKPAVPVTVEAAMVGPQAMTLSGLGHVQGLNTAVARAQTSGQILSILFTEGQTVNSGQPLAQIDPRPFQAALAQDEAALARDRAAQVNASDNLKRSAPLVAQGLASAQQVDGYKSQAAELAAAMAGDRAAIERDRLTLAYATIHAPISGVIGVRQIDPGNVVNPSDPAGIATIAQIQPIAVMFTLPQSAVTGIRAAMEAAGASGLGVDALAQGDGQLLDRGSLTVIDNHIDDASGTVTLKAVFPNARKLLWPGELITARVTLGRDANVITVPASAIQRNPSGTYVWAVSATGVASMRPVAAGPRLGDRIIISRGLAGGERVVTDGQFGLSPGARVTIAGSSPTRHPLKVDDPDRLGIQS